MLRPIAFASHTSGSTDDPVYSADGLMYAISMENIVQFHVFRGDRLWVAQCINLPIVTQAKTLDELAKNIEEALALHMEDGDASAECSSHPSVLVSFELPTKVHA